MSMTEIIGISGMIAYLSMGVMTGAAFIVHYTKLGGNCGPTCLMCFAGFTTVAWPYVIWRFRREL